MQTGGSVAKNIVICSDGTWNSAYKRRGTNVFKLFEAVDTSDDAQIAFYDDGVGTEKLRILRLLGGAFGLGLARNVRQLYTYLVRVYNPDDRIYLFGFSRGAFTVRTLAGMIYRCGIVKRTRKNSKDKTVPLTEAEIREEVRKTYKRYRSTYRRILTEHVPERSLPCVPIRMIGAWDTVDAVGLPFKDQAEALNLLFRFKFPNYRLPRNVQWAFHALAIDEERATFEPLLWEKAKDHAECEGQPCDEQVLEQVWFSGVHANVGGGYLRQGMSLVSLAWMMREARSLGLRFSKTARRGIKAAQNVQDRLYDSRSGVAALYRYKPREIGEAGGDGATVRIHESVVARIRSGTDGYAPAMLRANSELVPSGYRLAAKHREFWDKKRDFSGMSVKGLQLLRQLAHVLGLGVILAAGLVVARQLTGNTSGHGAWQHLSAWSLAWPIAIFGLSRIYRRDDYGREYGGKEYFCRHLIPHLCFSGALWLSILVFLREFFLESGVTEALNDLVTAASTVLGTGVGTVVLAAGGLGFVASAVAYFGARDLLEWEQFRTGTNMLWRVCLAFLVTAILWIWLAARHAPLDDLNAWVEANLGGYWIVAFALYMGLAWKRVARRAVLVGAVLYALLASGAQGLHTLLACGKTVFLWVFAPPKHDGAAALIVGLVESTGKVLGSWQGLLCLTIIILAYGASTWARRQIRDRAAAVWRGARAP